MLTGIGLSIETRLDPISLRTAVLFLFANIMLPRLILIAGAANKFTPVRLAVLAASLRVAGQEVGSVVQEEVVVAAEAVEEVEGVEEEEADEPQGRHGVESLKILSYDVHFLSFVFQHHFINRVAAVS